MNIKKYFFNISAKNGRRVMGDGCYGRVSKLRVNNLTEKALYNKAQHLHSVYLRINRLSGVVASGQN